MPATAQPKEVFAEHGVSFDRYSGAHVPTTFFFADEGKREQLGWVRGHLAEGAIYKDSFSQLKLVRLIGVLSQRRAA